MLFLLLFACNLHRNDLLGIDNAYIEVEYICRRGYTMRLLNHSTSIYCRNNQWIGHLPECEQKKISSSSVAGNDECKHPNKCKQMCHRTGGGGVEQCSCYKGFRMVKGNHQCVGTCIVSSGTNPTSIPTHTTFPFPRIESSKS